MNKRINKTYTMAEVAEILQVTRRTVYRYVQSDQLTAFKIGREYRVTEEMLKDFMEKGTDKDYLKILASKGKC